MPTPAYQVEVSDKPRSTPGDLKNIYRENSNWLEQFSPSQDLHANSFNDYVNYRKKKLKAVAPISQNPRALIELGDIHVSRGKFKHAIKPYQNAIKLDPKSVEAHKKLIPVLMIIGDTPKADRNYKELIKLTNGHPTIVNEYFGFKIATIKDKGEAIELKNEIKQSIKNHKEDARLFVTLGLLYLIHFTDVPGALNNFKYAIELDPQNIDAVNNLGICFQRKKQHKKAFRQYVQAIEIDKFYLPAYENIASNAAAQDDFRAAVDFLEQAKSLNIKLSDTWDHNYGWFLIQIQEFEKAAKWYKEKIPEEPDNSFLYNNMGVCLERLDRPKEAKDYYVESVEKYKIMQRSNPSVYDKRAEDGFLNACRMLQKFAQFEDLERVAKDMLSIGIVPEAGFYYLGSASIRLKKYQAAEKYLVQSLSIRDDVVDPYVDLGYYYDAISLEYDKAIELLKKGISKGFRDPLVFNNLAYAYIKTDQLSKAREILSKDLADPSFNATKGLLYLYEDNLKQANKEYESAIEGLPISKRTEATQVWKFELASYWYRKNNLIKAHELILESKKLSSEEVIYPQVIALEREIKDELRTKSLQ